MARTKTTVRPEPKTVADRIEMLCQHAYGMREKPSRQYIKKAMAEKYDYTNEANIKKTLGQMVKSGKLIQKGQTFYARDFVPEAEPEEWKPLPPDKKHCPKYEGLYSGGFPKDFESGIQDSDERSFWKLIFNMYQLGVLYTATGDESRAESFTTAWQNMLDCSNHCYEEYDKYGYKIGIGHDDMGRDMVANDVKCLRDIHGVGESTVKLIEEWIETGKLKRLEDLKEKCTPLVLKDLESFGDDKEKQEEEDFIEFLLPIELEELRILKKEMVNGVRVKVNDIVVMVNKKYVRYTYDFVERYRDFKTIASVKEDMKDNDAHKTEVVWQCSCPELPIAVGSTDLSKFNFVFHQDHDNDVEFEGLPNRHIDIDQRELEEVLTEKLVHPIVYEEDKQEEEFEAKHDYIPGFLEALGELAYLSDDFHATFLRRAIIALEGQIITAVEEIKLFKLIELKGVGKSTLAMLEEFIETGKIKRLVDLKATPDQVEWFSNLTKDQAGFIQDWWDEEGERKWATT